MSHLIRACVPLGKAQRTEGVTYGPLLSFRGGLPSSLRVVHHPVVPGGAWGLVDRGEETPKPSNRAADLTEVGAVGN